jgi:hypothetical protein
LKSSEFLSFYALPTPESFDHRKDVLTAEEWVLDLAEKDCRVKRKRVVESVKEYKLDRYHAIYYLLLQREKQNRINMEASMGSYKKQRRNSLKLNPIRRSIQRQGHENDLLKAVLDSKQRRGSFEIKQFRLRRAATPESPRRLLDCLALYKGVDLKNN